MALYIGLGLLLFFCILYLLVGLIITVKCLFAKSKNFNKALYDEQTSGISDYLLRYLPSSSVNMQSFDGLSLRANLFEIGDSDKWVIAFHGYRSHPITLRKYAFMFNSLGYNVLAVDSRRSGASEGRYVTFGYKEKQDCLDWIDYIKKSKTFSTLGLFGISMGATTAIMASENNNDIDFVIAYCPYSSYKDIIIIQVAKKIGKGLAKFFFPSVSLFSLLLTGLVAKKVSPKESIKKVSCKTMIMHSKEDDFTPYTQSVIIAEQNKDVCLHLFEKGAHARAFATDSKEYTKVVKEFLVDVDKMVLAKTMEEMSQDTED